MTPNQASYSMLIQGGGVVLMAVNSQEVVENPWFAKENHLKIGYSWWVLQIDFVNLPGGIT